MTPKNVVLKCITGFLSENPSAVNVLTHWIIYGDFSGFRGNKSLISPIGESLVGYVAFANDAIKQMANVTNEHH